MNNKEKNEGFTLLEVLIVTSLVSIIMLAVLSSMSSAQNTFTSGMQYGALHNHAELVMERIIEELQRAAIDGSNDVYLESANGVNVNNIATYNAVRYQKIRLNANGERVWSNFFIIKGFPENYTNKKLAGKVVFWEDIGNNNFSEPGADDAYKILASQDYKEVKFARINSDPLVLEVYVSLEQTAKESTYKASMTSRVSIAKY